MHARCGHPNEAEQHAGETHAPRVTDGSAKVCAREGWQAQWEAGW